MLLEWWSTPKKLETGGRLLVAKHDGQRWQELDAIRGIAACIVVLWHFYQVLSPEHFPVWIRGTMECTPLYLFISGTESVMLFFLLSGFVLSLPFHRNPGGQTYRSFLVKRIARIYFPYAVALLVAVLGNAYYHGLDINPWFAETWAGPVDLSTLLQHTFFLGNYDYSAFNTAFWSLVYEMRISLIFPFLCLLVIRSGWVRAIFLAIGIAVLSVLLRVAGVPGQTTETVKYVSFFIIGILLAQFAPLIREVLSKAPQYLRSVGILSSALCYSLGHLFPGAVKDALILTGASGILVAGFSEPAITKMLLWPLFQFLGRISYSIYLLHGTILYLLVYAFYPRIPLPWLFLPLVVGVLAASTAFYYLIEKPSIQIGRFLAKAVGPRGVVTPVTRAGPALAERTIPGQAVLLDPERDA
jgi:peptidoglycan/LPS O-acetylase OafA/YrhL